MKFFLICIILMMPICALSCNEKMLHDVQHYFEKIESVKSDFYQYVNGQRTNRGIFIYVKPSNIRLEYKIPDHILIIGKKKKLFYYNYDLDEAYYTSNSLLSSLTKLNLKNNMIIEDLSYKNKLLYLTASDINNTKFNIVFKTKPLRLAGLQNIDKEGNDIVLKFIKPKYNVEIDKKIFEFPKPSFFNKKRYP